MGKHKKTKTRKDSNKPISNESESASDSTYDKSEDKKGRKSATTSSDRSIDEIHATGNFSQNVKKEISDTVEHSHKSKIDSQRLFDSTETPDQSSESSESKLDDESIKLLIDDVAKMVRLELSIGDMLISKAEARKASSSNQNEDKWDKLHKYKQDLKNLMTNLDPKLAKSLREIERLKLEKKRLQEIREKAMRYISPGNEIKEVEAIDGLREEIIGLEADANEKFTTTSELEDEIIIDSKNNEGTSGRDASVENILSANHFRQSMAKEKSSKIKSNKFAGNIEVTDYSRNVTNDEQRNCIALGELNAALQFKKNVKTSKKDNVASPGDKRATEKNSDSKELDNQFKALVKFVKDTADDVIVEKDIPGMKHSYKMTKTVSPNQSKIKPFKELQQIKFVKDTADDVVVVKDVPGMKHTKNISPNQSKSKLFDELQQIKFVKDITNDVVVEKDVPGMKHSYKMTNVSPNQSKSKPFEELRHGLKEFFSSHDKYGKQQRGEKSALKIMSHKRDGSESEKSAAAMTVDELIKEPIKAADKINELPEVFEKVELERDEKGCDSSTGDIELARHAPQDGIKGNKVNIGREDCNRFTNDIESTEKDSRDTVLDFNADAMEIMLEIEGSMEKEIGTPKGKYSCNIAKTMSSDENKKMFREEKEIGTPKGKHSSYMAKTLYPDETKKLFREEFRRKLRGYLMFQDDKLDDVKECKSFESAKEASKEQQDLSLEKEAFIDVKEAIGLKTETDSNEEQGVRTKEKEQKKIKGTFETKSHRQQVVKIENQTAEKDKKNEQKGRQSKTLNIFELHKFENDENIHFAIENNGNKHITVGGEYYFFPFVDKQVTIFTNEDGTVAVSFIGNQVSVTTKSSEFDISVRKPHSIDFIDDASQTES